MKIMHQKYILLIKNALKSNSTLRIIKSFSGQRKLDNLVSFLFDFFFGGVKKSSGKQILFKLILLNYVAIFTQTACDSTSTDNFLITITISSAQ